MSNWQHLIAIDPNKVQEMEPSAFLAIFPYAFLASFPVFGVIIVTKWQLDERKKHRASRQPLPSS